MKTLTEELKKKKLSSKYMGIFPLEFDEDMDTEEETGVVIPDTIHVIPVGEWDHDLYGKILITNQDIREFAQNFNAGVRKGVFITAGHEGFEELPAVGWITEVEVRDTGLWGTVEWNEGGKELLSDKAFKFFSPEFYRDYEDPQTHQLYRNVLTGGALTKSPYFKELEAIVFSEAKLKNKYNEIKTMDLQTLLAKKIEELSTEEKAFIKEHAADLTDEQKVTLASVIEESTTESEEEKKARLEKEQGDANEAAGLNRDGSPKETTATDPEQVTASEKGGKMIQMSESEVNALRKKADEGAQAFAELKKQKLDATVSTLVFSESNKAGRFLPKTQASLRTFMETLSDDQMKKFSALISEIPKSEKFTEIGKDNAAVDGTAQAELDQKVNAKIEASEKSGKPMRYSEALKEVFAENKGLEERYTNELPTARKSA
jgi:hypothetical protein